MRVACMLVLLGVLGCGGRDDGPRAELADRVQDYVALRRRLEADLPPLAPGADAETIEKRRAALAEKLVAASPDARSGTIFTPRVGAAVRGELRTVLAGDDGKNARGAILDENPKGIRVEPRRPYPDGAPLSRVPASVLAVLPPVPDDVEYRFVGRDLILRDTHANVVIDVLPAAVP
jgi:hypothetical protein